MKCFVLKIVCTGEKLHELICTNSLKMRISAKTIKWLVKNGYKMVGEFKQ